MKYLKNWRIFESVTKPTKKFPTEPAIHFNYLESILKSVGIDAYMDNGGRSTSFFNFCFKKCSKEILFPNRKDNEGWGGRRYEDFIFGESIFLLPKSYDSSGDADEAIQKKKNFLDKMREFARTMGKSKEEQDKFVDDAEKNTSFGPTNYEWANPALKAIHDELGQYYKDGKLRVWFPSDRDYDAWEGMDYPHKYNIVGDLENPSGVYFLSDIEKYIDDKYGIKDEMFYNFIIKNEYIEGRYWERVWNINANDDGSLMKNGFGMKATENITHILNIIEKDFKEDIIPGDGKGGFKIYIDYFKDIEDNYED